MKRLQHTRRALGSEASITLVLADDADNEVLFKTLWQKIDAFEQRFSRFLPESELSRFNHAAGAQQATSAAFHSLLVATREMARKTRGLYNPFVLPALQRAGYKGSWPQPETVHTTLNYEQRTSAAWEALTVGDDWAKIPKGTALDFGGIGKGYLLDQLGAWLHTQATPNYWLSLGGDILCSGYDVTGDAWQIGIQHATQSGHLVAHVANNGRQLAVATSGITKRKGGSGSTAWHHIIDPRTQKPARTDILTATVCAATSMAADVAAKCLVITGSSGAARLMRSWDIQDSLLQLRATASPSHITKIGNIWLP